MLQLQLKALSKGARAKDRSLHNLEWEAAGNCMRPVRITRESRRHPVYDRKGAKHRSIDIEVPCRQCAACLRRRSRHWNLRAKMEVDMATRTWFGTLTLSPVAHNRIEDQCRMHLIRNGLDFDVLPPNEKFRERHKLISQEITRYIKRLRETSGASLRILFIAERHKNGLPHYHALVHEIGDVQIKHRMLTSQWTLGFTKWNLLTDKQAASYVTKYLSKDAVAKIRASVGYGNRPRPNDIDHQ